MNDHFGKRLQWARYVLKMKKKEVSLALKIPYTTYPEREQGLQTSDWAQIKKIAEFFDSLWQERHAPNRYPRHNGEFIKSITMLWVMFGEKGDRFTERDMAQAVQENMLSVEKDRADREDELKRQIALFCVKS